MEKANGHADVQRLIGAVAERHGILLKPDDAAFALVTINQLMLEEAMTELLGRVQRAAADFEEAAQRVQTKAGGLIANEVKTTAVAIRGELESEIAAVGKQAHEFVLEVYRSNTRANRMKWLSVGVICALALFVCGILVGKMIQ